MTYQFWLYETDLPTGLGFDPFSRSHLLWVSIALAAIVMTIFLHRRQNPSTRLRTEKILAVTIGMTYILRWIWALSIGHFRLAEMLPLHLCAVAAIIEIIAVFNGRPLLREFGYACGLPGAIVVFLTPGIGAYPVLHFYYLLFILDHTILMLLPLLWVVNDGFRPDWRRLPACFGIVLAMAGVDVLVNSLIGSNYMFLNSVPANTFWSPAADWFGVPGYQAAMAGLLLVVWALLYLPWMIAKRRRQRIGSY